MLVSNDQISGWQDLQEKVAVLFREMGYQADTEALVQLARGKKKVDVRVFDPRASVNQTMLIECKFWASAVPQDTVHSFHTVMGDAGANTGFIISKVGFQPGAREAALHTNIHLLTWEELQHKFGQQWLLWRRSVFAPLEAELRGIDRTHLEQLSPAPIVNNMRYTTAGQSRELLELLNSGRVLLLAKQPDHYDQPGPFKVWASADFMDAEPNDQGDYFIHLPDVRTWFEWAERSAREILTRYKALTDRVHGEFDELPEEKQEAVWNEAMRSMAEESPVRVRVCQEFRVGAG